MLPTGSHLLRRSVSPFFQLIVHLRTQTRPSPFSSPSSCLSSSNTCQHHCPPLRKSKPMQACSCDLFNGALPTGRVPLFREPFLPGFRAISKGASVFPLREAWCSLLAGCDNGPHMVVLQWLTKTWGLGAWAQAPALPPLPPNRPIKHSSSQPFVWALSLCLSSAGPFVLLSGAPVPQRPLPQLCSLHLQYATNKYSRNAMNASLSVSVNVPK